MKTGRRAFLKQFAGSIGAAGMASHWFTLAAVKAVADATAGNGPLKADRFLFVSGHQGGPSRWAHDLPLTPNGASDPFIQATLPVPFLVNSLTRNGSALEGLYQTVEVGGYHVPVSWSELIPTVSGTLIPASSALRNALFIRGMTKPNGLHNVQHLTDINRGNVSLDGAVADASAAPIAGVRTNGAYYMIMRSQKGNSLSSGAATDILGQFQESTDTTALFSSAQITSTIETALAALTRLSEGYERKLGTANSRRAIVRKLMKSMDLNVYGARFNMLYGKYNQLGQACLNPSLYPISFLNMDVAYDPSVRLMHASHTPDPSKSNYLQLLAAFDPGQFSEMIYAFALAEFFAETGLSSVVVSSHGDDWYYGGMRSRNDAHESGAYNILFDSSLRNRIHTAMLYELIESLKKIPDHHGRGGSIFDRTIIEVGGDFGRSVPVHYNPPVGTEHAPEATSLALYSGMFDRFRVIGDLRTSNLYGGGDFGTYGGGAPLPETGRKFEFGMALSSIANLLGVESPAPNDAPLITRNSTTGKATSPLFNRRPRNV